MHGCRVRVLLILRQVLLLSIRTWAIWQNWCLDLKHLQRCYVDVGKPFVLQYFCRVVRGPQSQIFVFGEELTDQIHDDIGVLDVKSGPRWEDHSGVLDLGQQDLSIPIEEGACSEEHFKDQNADRPPIDHPVMSRALHDFRGEVLSCAAESHCLLVAFQKLCQAEVDNFDVAIGVDEDVLKLDVPVDDAFFVKLAQTDDDLRRVELDHSLR